MTCTPRSTTWFGDAMRLAKASAWFLLLIGLGAALQSSGCLAEELRVDLQAGALGDGETKAISDPVLQRSWRIVRNEVHPGWPAVWVSGPKEVRVSPPANRVTGELLVTAGESVSAWRSETAMRMYLQATSEENGRMGAEIRVHVKVYDPDGRSLQRQMKAVVRGKASVELEP